MQNYIDRALESFQHVFSSSSEWLLFCAIVIVNAIEIYCARTRNEILFSDLKHLGTCMK